MAVSNPHRHHPSLVVVFHFLIIIVISSYIPQSSCQSGSSSPRNILVIYPFALTPPPPNPPSPALQPSNFTPIPPPSPSLPPPTGSSSSSSTSKKVGAAVGITAATTLVLCGLLFFLLQRCSKTRKDATTHPNPYAASSPFVPQQNEFMGFNGNLKGIIVDEDGLDVIYWKKLEGADGSKKKFEKQAFRDLRNLEEKEEEENKVISKADHQKYAPPSPEFPLLRGKSSSSQSPIWNDVEIPYQKNASRTSFPVSKQDSSVEIATLSLPPPAPPPPPAAAAEAPVIPMAARAISKNKAPSPPPHPPPGPPPIPFQKIPPPPPVLPKAKTVAVGVISKPPPIPKGGMSNVSKKKESLEVEGDGQVKLKPLHWDKVHRNVEHSMVWDKLGGSFKVDDDLMEALFGYVATNRKSPRSNASTPTGRDYNNKPGSSSQSQIFILDTRKSQNIAIVLKSLGISRDGIIDVLIQGEDLSLETLEKLTRIAPSKEEQSEILAFNGDPARLADAESFLYHLLKAVPSAFTRFNALLFRSNFNQEVPHLKESFQVLESGCKELRARGLLLKLLEAILKAGNRMNAGTSRGNAQAFDLTALRKLSDVKSTDGKTTLLHFVVEEVFRAEGKRCYLNQKGNLNRSNSQGQSSNPGGGNSQSGQDREKEYIMLGLPIVGGLSAEFSNVKKVASFDYDTLLRNITALGSQVAEIRKRVQQCAGARNETGGFAEQMKGFLNSAEEEMRIIGEEQTRVMELVKRTTEYFQSGANDKGWQPLQIFVIVSDFLDKVDKACVDIARNVQKRKPTTTTTTGKTSGSSSPESPKSRPAVKFPKLPANFMSS